MAVILEKTEVLCRDRVGDARALVRQDEMREEDQNDL